MKQTKRKSVNFLRSYFDVLNKLNDDKDKLSFLLSILNKQFLNEDPTNLSMLVDLSYESQRHQLESSVKGWETRTGNKLGSPTEGSTITPTLPPTETPTEGISKTSESRYEGSTLPPYGQEEVKEEAEVKVKVKVKEEAEVKEQVKRRRTKPVENPHSRFLEPNDCIEKLLNEKLTKQSN